MAVVKSSFEGDNKIALLGILLPKPEYEAMCVHDALKVIWCSCEICFDSDVKLGTFATSTPKQPIFYQLLHKINQTLSKMSSTFVKI